MNESALIEQLADKEHASWARWMKYLFSKCNRDETTGALVIPEPLIWRWQRQADIPYTELTEREKQYDRDEVAHILPIIYKHFREKQ